MTETRFYQLSAALPIALPLVLVLPLVIDDRGGRIPEIVAVIVGYFFWAGMIGGIPYCLLAAASLWRLRHAPASAYRRFALRVPWLYAAFLWFCFTAVQLAAGSLDRETILAGVILAGLAVPTAYFYVGVVHLLRGLLVRLGKVREATSP